MVGARQAISRSGDFKTRAADGNLYIEGYFATFTGEYRMWDKAIERIDRGAFDGTLGDDIRALVNHDTTIVLGRTTAGTLTLRVDDLGLWGSMVEARKKDLEKINERKLDQWRAEALKKLRKEC